METAAPLQWPDGRDACEARGTSLTSVHDLAANDFLLGHLTKRGGSFSEEFWLGGNDQAVEGTFEWTDATPWDFEAWGRNEPNDTLGGEDCVGMSNIQDGWNDRPCTTSAPRAFVCRSPHPD